MKNWQISAWSFAFFAIFVAATFVGCWKGTSKDSRRANKESEVAQVAETDAPIASVRPTRIVSTVPSVTETLFALGLGDSVVAVSNYCQYPSEVANLPKIGSLFEFNVEKIVELSPDFVVVLKENEGLVRRLNALGVETFAVEHSSLDGVLASFETLGRRGGVEAFERGKTLRAETEARIALIRKSVEGAPRPRVLVAIDRTPGIGKIADVFVAGQNPYYNDILSIVGATNAAESLWGAAPTTSPEGIVALNPDVVVDLSTDGVYTDEKIVAAKIDERRDDWKSLGNDVAAVKNDRIYPILDLFATVPGPRTVLFLEKLADFLHPDRVRGAVNFDEH